MKTQFLFTICMLACTQLNAQQLYFIRTNTNIDEGEFQYTELPPTQVIAYTPNQDTLLHIYKDYTDDLPYSYNTTSISSVEFYPEHNVFVFKLYDTGFEAYALYASNPDTLIKMPTQCPKSYSVSPFLSMNIIKGHWAYECSCDHDNFVDEDYARFKGIDFSLSDHFDMSASDFKDLYLTGKVVQRMGHKPNDGRMYLPIVAGIENRPPFSVELPQKYWSSNEKYMVVWVNDDHKTLIQTKKINPTKDEDYGHFYAALYHKDKNTWSDIELKGNSPTTMRVSDIEF